MDYSKTVNLPQTAFPMKADLPKREPEFLARWEAEKIYETLLEKRKDAPTFILHDGPPYANGHLHIGHALNKILKDMIVRYKAMSGFYAPYVPGWDCHGLPIELQLMKDLKIDQHKVDRERFRKQAGEYAAKWVGIQRDEFKRLGVMGDWENPYLTMDESFKAIILDSFNKLQEKGFAYKGRKPVYWCASCETALADAEVEYENDPGPAIHVAFALHSPPSFNEEDGGHGSEDKAVLWTEFASFVIWTTTPWTLPANLAIAYNPDETYVLFEVAPNKRYILAEKRLADFQALTQLEGKVIDRTPGFTFQGAFAKHPWMQDHFVPLLPASFVAMDTGTGLVHIAPGHGMEDYQLGMAHDLDVVSPVDDRGRLTDEVPEWKGVFVFDANPLIVEHLKSIGALVHTQTITHSYPHCWRCHKAIIFRATDQWFLNVDHDVPLTQFATQTPSPQGEGKGEGIMSLRQRLIAELDRVQFVPAYGKNRIRGMLESRPDWCLSRQRIWGTEIPQSQMGGKADGKSNLPLIPPSHQRDGSPDIFDVWFESGVTWNAVLKHRYKTKDTQTASGWEKLSFPADLYLEGSDQHRGWFQTSLIPSVALEGKAPFKAVLTHGFVVDGEGRKMSKSLGNVIKPEEILKDYGADILRLWVASSDYDNDIRLSPEILKGLADTYRKVRNSFRFLLGNVAGFDEKIHRVPVEKMQETDQWILMRLAETLKTCDQAYNAYEFHKVVVTLVEFCTVDLSSLYLDVTKDRLYCDAPDSLSRRAAQTVLFDLAKSLSQMWAPILAFTADEAWRSLGFTEPIALTVFAKPPAVELDAARQETWTRLFRVRDTILLELEKARQAGLIKNALQAKVSVSASTQKEYDWLVSVAPLLKSICLVSDVELHVGKDTLTVTVAQASGQKCSRCWIYKSDVETRGSWQEVCERCAQVLDQLSPSLESLTSKA